MKKQDYSDSLGRAIAYAIAEGASRSSLEGKGTTLSSEGPGRPRGLVFPERRQINRWIGQRDDFAGLILIAEGAQGLSEEIRQKAYDAWAEVICEAFEDE
jgi:hypothetical protein